MINQSNKKTVRSKIEYIHIYIYLCVNEEKDHISILMVTDIHTCYCVGDI